MIPPSVYPAGGGITMASYQEVRPSGWQMIWEEFQRAERQVGG